jgi:hypothetical protein
MNEDEKEIYLDLEENHKLLTRKRGNLSKGFAD